MYRLLVADDEIIERKVLLKTLQKNLEGQCELFQAENGREALEIYEKEKIQIAILDIEMPGINGIQAAEKIREKDKNCCIIFLTAYDEFSYAQEALRLGAAEYLLKPCNTQKLYQAVRRAAAGLSERERKTRMDTRNQKIFSEIDQYAKKELRSRNPRPELFSIIIPFLRAF